MKKFNKDKYLKKLKLKRFWQNNSRYFYIGVPCVLCGILGIYFAYSKFFVTQEDAVVQTSVGNFVYGDVIINNYVNGKYTVEAPARGTGYKVDKIVCNNGAVGEWSGKDWGPIISNVTRRSKCNIYFVDVDKINIGNVAVPLDYYGVCPTVNADGTVSVTEAEKQYGYLCKAKDAYGDSYYYRGNVTNNYVKFADKYWRIIRINGDGTVRVIYDGTSAHTNGESSTDRQIGTSIFNDWNRSNNTLPGDDNSPVYALPGNDNAHVGYMYGKTGASTYAETHANTNNSTIKTYLDTWYENNIKGTSNEQYVKDNLFCNDRSFASRNSGTGLKRSQTSYNWAIWHTSKINLKCPQQNDAFTVSDTTNGNGALTYGVGLVTTDEVILAGGWSSKNVNYYLYSGRHYWTMSPDNFYDRFAIECIVYSDGSNINTRHDPSSVGGFGSVINSNGARPVLNLSSDVLKNGNGTASDPYHLAS